MTSGPDFDATKKWRRLEDAAFVSPIDFNRGMARRIEGQVRTDATALPIIRSACYKWSVEHKGDMSVPYFGKRDRPGSVIATELVQAAQSLYKHLWQGSVTYRGGKKMPIAGDTTKLPFADGLTQLE